jgi:hypothetical protein
MKLNLRMLAAILAIATCHADAAIDEDLRQNFLNPPMTCRPQTYWFWPGSGVTEKEITWELQQMHDHGLGGVLINSAFSPIYEKGSIPFLSDEHLAMLRHAVLTAKKLDMKVTLNFSGGWVFGGFWVPPQERSQSLVPAALELTGPRNFSRELPKFKKAADHRGEITVTDIPDSDKLVAVVAGRIVDGKMEAASLVDLTLQVQGSTLHWSVPAGDWQVTAFWLKYTGQRTVAPDYGQDHWCVDHFSRTAMKNYCDFIGGKFYQAVGDEFGKTVEALHCDSFEMASLPNGIYWSDSLMTEFRQYKGYDLARYLPALWWSVSDISPKIRYDVNDFLNHAGLGIFFSAFFDWCHRHNVQGSMEPYGFSTDILQGAGRADIPIMEITPGEKDAVPWFDTRIGPRRYVASGADLYGRNIIGVEAYTFIHWEIFRATLEELKIASDGFFCAGANKFYNHLYSYTPEREAAPSRTLPWEAVINHTNIWWKYYRLLADYIARCCFLLRLGAPVKDIAVYSPLANQWTLDVQNARKWTRDFYWGELGKLIAANGYDFDLVNDKVLQHQAQLADGKVSVGSMEYKILILPNIQAMPLETLESIQRYVKNGGVVIALERVPESSTGFVDYAARDAKVRALVSEMFTEPVGDNGTGPRDFGKGRTYHIKLVINRQDVLDWRSSALDPFVNTLREHTMPDVSIDLSAAGLRENNGVSFAHRKVGENDLYFVSNIQERSCTTPVTFRIQGKVPWRWNPYDGTITRLCQYRAKANSIEVPLDLAPYESMFLLLQPDEDSVRVEPSSLRMITDIKGDALIALAGENGVHQVVAEKQKRRYSFPVTIKNVPPPFQINGQWTMILEGNSFARVESTLTQLVSWTSDPRTKHFSGTGRYETSFALPSEYLAPDLQLELDLGSVGNVAEVEVNGKRVGICWMRNQRLNITRTVSGGSNRLVVLVTNTLINRASGLTQLVPVPEDLVAHYGRGTTSYSAGFRGPVGFKPLPASGLLGPVRIIATKKFNLPLR